MDTLKQIIQQCHNRMPRTLSQRKTIVLPARYNEYPYHFRVHYAYGESVILYNLEKANISFLPIGQSPFDRAPSNWGNKKRIKNRQNTQNWGPRRWYASWGSASTQVKRLGSRVPTGTISSSHVRQF